MNVWILQSLFTLNMSTEEFTIFPSKSCFYYKIPLIRKKCYHLFQSPKPEMFLAWQKNLSASQIKYLQVLQVYLGKNKIDHPTALPNEIICSLQTQHAISYFCAFVHIFLS